MKYITLALTLTTMTTTIALTSLAQEPRLEGNKAVVRRVFTEIFSRGDYRAANEIYAKDFINHETTKDIRFEEDQAGIHGWRAAFPDLEMTIEKAIAEGDFVTILWKGRGTNSGNGNGLNATGKKAEGRGISIFRLADGKIEEEWTEYSQLVLLRQLGLMKSPGQ